LRRSSDDRVTRSSEREISLRDKHQTKAAEETTMYSAEILLYDRQRRCPLTAGRYDVAVEEPRTSKSSSPLGKHSTWEAVTDGKVHGFTVVLFTLFYVAFLVSVVNRRTYS